jgi:hydroxylamine reductase
LLSDKLLLAYKIKSKEYLIMEHKMFCYQCQETAGCSGCTQMGVCGKKPEVAAMQDLLVYVSKGLSAVTTQLRKEGTKVSEETNHLITWNLFTTITNANFDNEAIIARIHNTLSVRRTLILQVKDTSGLPEAAFWDIKTKDGSDASDDVLFAKAKEAGVLSTKDEDIRSLRDHLRIKRFVRLLQARQCTAFG